jgi:excisionase family DNA binding protein
MIGKKEDLMTVKEVANYLRLHEISIYRMIKKGVIPAFKVGGCWRFKRERLDRWLHTHETGQRRRKKR